MKEKFKKIYAACLKITPVCAAFALSVLVNSTGSWARGQEELPAGAKRYRKF